MTECTVDGCAKPSRRIKSGLCGMHYMRLLRNGTVEDRPTLTGEERLWAKVDKTGDCWLWTGGRNSEGYGTMWLDGQNPRVHRLAYEWLVGPIPEGTTLDHTCHDPEVCDGGTGCPHRVCVNPAHLEPVPNRTNVLRGGGLSAENARKTHCIRDHEFTPKNTRIDKKGKRVCLACRRLYAQKEKEVRRARAQA